MQGLLQFHTTHPRHPNIQQEAARLLRIVVLEKHWRGRIVLNGQTIRLSQSADCPANIRVVVNDEQRAQSLGSHRIDIDSERRRANVRLKFYNAFASSFGAEYPPPRATAG